MAALSVARPAHVAPDARWLSALSRGLERAWTSSLEAKGTHIVAVRKGAVELLNAALDEELSAPLRQVEGVAAVSAELGDLVELGVELG